MKTRTFKIMGYDGAVNRASFGTSRIYDLSEISIYNLTLDPKPVTFTVLRKDVTGSNLFVVVTVTAETAEMAGNELYNKLWVEDDSFLSNCNFGDIYELTDHGIMEGCYFDKINLEDLQHE